MQNQRCIGAIGQLFQQTMLVAKYKGSLFRLEEEIIIL